MVGANKGPVQERFISALHVARAVALMLASQRGPRRRRNGCQPRASAWVAKTAEFIRSPVGRCSGTGMTSVVP